MWIERELIAAALVLAAAAGCASPYGYRNTAYNPGHHYGISDRYPSAHYYPVDG